MAPRSEQPVPKTALVLGGGGARGFAHIGTLRVLGRTKLTPDIVTGTSIGAIIGAFVASGYRADDIYNLAARTLWRELFDFSLGSHALFKGEKLTHFLRQHLPETFEALDIPLAVMATDLERGEEVVLYQGNLIAALRASSCFPGAFDPVEVGGRKLVDGGLLNNLPVSAATFLGASRIIASDVSVPRTASFEDDGSSWLRRTVEVLEFKRRAPLTEAVMRSIDIMQSVITEARLSLHPASLCIRHRLVGVNIEAFWAFESIVKAGEETAELAFRKAGLLE